MGLQTFDLTRRGLREGTDNGQFSPGTVKYNDEDPPAAKYTNVDALRLWGRVVQQDGEFSFAEQARKTIGSSNSRQLFKIKAFGAHLAKVRSIVRQENNGGRT